MSSRNQASTPVLFAAVVLATGAEVSRDMAYGQQTSDWSGYRQRHIWCGSHFLLSMWRVVLVGAMTMPLSPAAVCPGENSGNSCLSQPPGISHLCTARCIHIRLAFAQLFSMVTEPGDQIPLTSSGSTNVIASWSVTPKTPTVSRLSHYWWFTTIQGEEVIEWHSPNMWKIKSENMACLALTDKAEMHRGHVC